MADTKLTTPGDNTFLGIASLTTGGHVVVWSGVGADGTEDILQQRSDANGLPVGPVEVVNTQTAGRQANGQVGQLANGGYVVAWSTQATQTSPFLTHIQIFDGNGARVGSEFEASTANAFPRDVIGLAGGGFILDYQDTGAGSGLYLQNYSDTGQLLGQVKAGPQSSVSGLTALAGGNFVFFDSSDSFNAGGGTLRGQVYSVSGGVMTATGSSFPVNTTTTFGPTGQYHSQVGLPDGGFLITWAAPANLNQTDVYVRRFDAAGAPVTAEILANTVTVGSQYNSEVTALSDGGWFVAWSSATGSAATSGARGQRFDASGAMIGPEITLSDPPSSIVRGMTLAGDGSLVVGWTNLVSSPNTFEIYQTHFNMIDGDTGANTLTAPAGDIRDMIHGGVGADTLSGLDGGDVLYGGDGDDILIGGAGNDQMDGGAGSDTASYAGATAGVSADLNLAGPQAVGGAEGSDTLSTIENLTGSAFNDTLIGNGQNNVIIGGDGLDTINGGDGDDTIDGGAGHDTISPGLGNDTIVQSLGVDVISYAEIGGSVAGNGHGVTVDLRIEGAQDTIGAGVDTLGLIRNLVGSQYGDSLIGSVSNDTIDGGGGDDVIEGGQGNDTLTGGAGSDTASYAGAAAGVSVDLRITTVQDTLAGGGDVLTGFENLTGSAFNDFLAGDAGNNVLSGLAGDDLLVGGAGDDTLNGGAGIDTARYQQGATSGITIDLSQSGAQNVGGGFGSDTFISIEGIAGTAFNDSLTGDGADNIFTGGAGDDYLNGGAGSDTASFAGETRAVYVSLSGVARDGGGTPITDTLVSIENLIGTDFSDTLIGDAGANRLVGGLNDDALYGEGGDDVLVGGDGNDYLSGGDGNDNLTGGDGEDLFIGDLGDDVLDGGNGLDRVDYSGVNAAISVNLGLATAQNTGGAGVDTLISISELVGTRFGDVIIGDGNSNYIVAGDGDDLIVSASGPGVDRLDGGNGNDTVSYTSAASAVTVTLATPGVFQNTGGGGADRLYNIENLTGSAFGDSLTGDAGANILMGLGGSDVLEGGAGDDRLDGGDGNDVASYAGASSGVTVNLGVQGSPQATGGAGSDTLISIADLFGSAFADVLLGDELNNILAGGLGNDTLSGFGSQDVLHGEDGDDVLDGGDGNDLLDGGNGLDTASYASATGAVNVDLALGVAAGFGGADHLIRIENIIGTGYADTLTGDAGANVLSGMAGADTLVGGAGDDQLVGGDGDDILEGGAGNDQLIGGQGAQDVASYANATGGVSVNLTLAGAQNVGGGEGSDTLSGVESLTGSLFADVLIGDAGANTLLGSDGDDILDGGQGDDVMNGGAGIDTVSYAWATSGVKVTAVGSNQNTGGGGNDTLISIENIIGTAYADTLTGEGGANLLVGGGGDDSLIGGGGADRLYGGTGDDRFVVDSQDDVVFEFASEGTDLVVAVADYYLYDNIENLSFLGTADLYGVGNALANLITGNDGANLLLGGGGNDTINGGAGDDHLFGEAGDDVLNGDAGSDIVVGGLGNDTVNGGDGADSLYGEDGNDVLVGGLGVDMLIAGLGNDTLNGQSGAGEQDLMDGGAGNDSYLVDAANDLTFEVLNGGTDTVTADIAGGAYYLYANVENLILAGTTLYGVGNELDNVITGNASANWLLGGAGNDTLNGKAGGDVLFGQGGADTFVFEHGTGGDVIGDFTVGVDKVSLAGIYGSFAEVQSHMVQNGGDSAIDLGQGDLVVFQHVAMASFTAGDFLF